MPKLTELARSCLDAPHGACNINMHHCVKKALVNCPYRGSRCEACVVDDNIKITETLSYFINRSINR